MACPDALNVVPLGLPLPLDLTGEDGIICLASLLPLEDGGLVVLDLVLLVPLGLPLPLALKGDRRDINASHPPLEPYLFDHMSLKKLSSSNNIN